MTRQKRDKLAANAEQLRAIGEVCLQWAYAEIKLLEAIGCLLNTDRFRLRAMTADSNSIMHPTNQLENLLEIVDISESNKVIARSYIGFIRKNSQKRNAIVHGYWAFDYFEKKTINLTFKGKHKFHGHREEISAAQIFKFADEIFEQGTKFNLFLLVIEAQRKRANADGHAISLKPNKPKPKKIFEK